MKEMKDDERNEKMMKRKLRLEKSARNGFRHRRDGTPRKQGLTVKERQFVGILARGWDADGTIPVEVHVAQLVKEELELVPRPLDVIVDDVVVCR